MKPKTEDRLDDSPADLTDASPLGRFLLLCEKNLRKPFQDADDEALSYQNLYRWLTTGVAVIGSAALLLAAANIAFREGMKEEWPVSFKLEAFLAATTALGVVLGLFLRWHEKWLLARYKAEQFRLLKFRFLVRPEFWGDGLAYEGENHFLNEIRRIDALQFEDLAEASEREQLPLPPTEAHCSRIDRGLLYEIAAYYRRKRLETQIRYFTDKAKRDSRHWYQNPRLLPLAFFLSVLFVFAHATVEAWGAWPSNIERAGQIALAFSLAIPAGWAAVRTYRSANESGRNASRSAAKNEALLEISDRLNPRAPAIEVFIDMAVAEHILASDQAEWLRLMREAEWYG